MKYRFLILGATVVLAGCAGDVIPPPRTVSYVPPPRGGPLLDKIIGQSAPGLTALFGPPAADVREGPARKLQFGNATCVLDAYLYPKAGREPVVTYVDARQTDGSPIDRASCVSALQAGRRR